MNRKSFLKYYFSNIAIVLFSMLFVFWGVKGSVQERLLVFKEGGIASLKLGLQTVILLVAGIIFSLLILKVLKLEADEKSNKHRICFLIIGWVFYFVGLLLLVAKKWAQDRFPMHTPEIVYFTLKNVEGSFDVSIIYESIKISVCCFLFSAVQCVLSCLLEKKRNFSVAINVLRKKLPVNIGFLYFLLGLGTFSLALLG